MFYPVPVLGYKTATNLEIWMVAGPMALAIFLCFLVGWYAGWPVTPVAFLAAFVIQAYGVLFGPPNPSRVRLQYAWLNGRVS